MVNSSGVFVEFGSGELSLRSSEATGDNKIRIGWYLNSEETQSASTRYRCYHFARVVTDRFHSRYFTDFSKFEEALHDLDVIVIVKRMDRLVVQLVALAETRGIPVFLDICDDLMNERYAKNADGINLLYFKGISSSLAGVLVPSAEMADQIERYVRDGGAAWLPIHVVPDIAETYEIYRATEEFVTGKRLPALSAVPPVLPKTDRRRIIWFGNFGASYSNFGIFSLKPYLKDLREVAKSVPLELIVVSNNKAVYDALVENCMFPTAYVPWSAEAVYKLLETADLAILTSSNDIFGTLKSSNRVLQSLAVGVPVLAPKGSAVAEFDAVIPAGRTSDLLQQMLGPTRSRFVEPRLAAAKQILSRYTPEVLGEAWARLVRSAVERRRRPAGGNIVFLVESGAARGVAERVLKQAKAVEGLDCELLVATEALEQTPQLGAVLHRAGVLPRFFSSRGKVPPNVLAGCALLVVEGFEAPITRQLRDEARRRNVKVLTYEQVEAAGIATFRPSVAEGVQAPSVINAGPNAEWSEPDGSVDWLFVVHEKGRGWILDAICREIGSRQPASWKVHYHPGDPPVARNIFFSHYALLEIYSRKFPEVLANSRIFVWYTHPREEDPVSVARLLVLMEQLDKVYFACASNRDLWLRRGLPDHKAAVVLGGADRDMFVPHHRGQGVVGLSSSFYERKNPDCLLEVMKLLPHRRFVLLGRRWNQYARFEEMKALPNFTYVSASYRDYPAIYAQFDVFLSMSLLEGGPIPLIEAMMCNAVPVASRTGFAPDLILHGENGYLFEIDAAPREIADLIEAGFALETDVSGTVARYDWNYFSNEIIRLAQ